MNWEETSKLRSDAGLYSENIDKDKLLVLIKNACNKNDNDEELKDLIHHWTSDHYMWFKTDKYVYEIFGKIGRDISLELSESGSQSWWTWFTECMEKITKELNSDILKEKSEEKLKSITRDYAFIIEGWLGNSWNVSLENMKPTEEKNIQFIQSQLVFILRHLNSVNQDYPYDYD